MKGQMITTKLMELNSTFKVSSGAFHPEIISPYFNIRSFYANCGIMLFFSFSACAPYIIKTEKFNKLCSLYKENGCGAFIAVLGQDHFGTDKEKLLERLGFVEIHQYINWRHSDTYTQKLYIREIK